jgi:hypothetical protein
VNEVRNQSSLNRLLTESPFGLRELNTARLAMLAGVPGMEIKKTTGVLSLDDSLLVHYGQHFEKIAKLWDHVDNRYVWAHNLVSLHYSDEQTDYPIGFQLWEPPDLEKLERGLPEAGVTLRADKFSLKTDQPKKWRQYLLGVWQRNQSKAGVAALHKSKLLIGRGLIQEFVDDYPGLKIAVTFDSWYTQPAFCRFLNEDVKLPYVGTVTASDEVILQSGKMKLGDFAESLKEEHDAGGEAIFRPVKIRYKGESETYYSYCRTHRIAKFGKQRLVINFRQEDLTDSPVFYNCNRFRWQAKRITSTRRHRWPVEVYYEEGKRNVSINVRQLGRRN